MILVYSSIIILIILIIYYINVEKLRSISSRNLEDIKFKTGDIIMTRYDHINNLDPVKYIAHNIISYVLTRSLETHSAIVIVIDNKPYVYHVTYLFQYDHSVSAYRRKSPVLVDLKTYVMGYNGEMLHYPIKNELNILKSMKFIDANKYKEFTYSQLEAINTVLKLPTSENEDSKFCLQLTMDYLNYMDVINGKYPAHLNHFGDVRDMILSSGKFEKPSLILNPYLNYVKNKKLIFYDS